MSLAVDVFWSFRSPYSYLATPQLAEIARAWDVSFNIRIVRPLAVRDPAFFKRRDPRPSQDARGIGREDLAEASVFEDTQGVKVHGVFMRGWSRSLLGPPGQDGMAALT